MRTRPAFIRRPIVDLALVVAVIGLLAVAYVIAGSSWPSGFGTPAAPLVQTTVLGPGVAAA